jgi:hypothetical protein
MGSICSGWLFPIGFVYLFILQGEKKNAAKKKKLRLQIAQSAGAMTSYRK